MKTLSLICFLMVLFTGTMQSRNDNSEQINRSPVSTTYTRHNQSDSVYIAWVRHFTDPDSLSVLTGFAVDDSGNVYVSAVSESECVTIKYNADGTVQWIVRDKSPDTYIVLARIDDLGNVYAIGRARINSQVSSDYITIKYKSSGKEEWTARYNGPDSLDDIALSLAVDRIGNVYVTGRSRGLNTLTDFATVKYNSSGIQQWIARYNGPGNNGDEASHITIDEVGNVYVTGLSYDTNTFTDRATIKYNSDGKQLWVTRYNGPMNSQDFAGAIIVDKSGNIYVSGRSEFKNGRIIGTTVKYKQSQTVAVKDESEARFSRCSLSQNYPHPFNPSTHIHYALAKHGHVTLKVFNLQGQEIATLVNEKKPAGEYEIPWNPTTLPSGVYVYRLQAGEFVKTKKLILMK